MGKRAIQEIVCSSITIAVAIVAFVLTFDMPERVFVFPRIASVTLFVFAGEVYELACVREKKEEELLERAKKDGALIFSGNATFKMAFEKLNFSEES
jgi:hypothetical protein